ncbi:hypothetical protein SDC9_104883 [bioreactor metagenome]|uniref:VOC domain-containing protein n=1 Tax=bioreactor metagenome TaxID=1076179 RepID=A0A645B8N7_9ZZZZ
MFKMDAVGLFVTDMTKMVAFYRDVMEMKTDWNGSPDAVLTSGQQRLIMFSRANFEKMTEQVYTYPAGTNGTMELSFSVPRFHDVDIAYAKALKAGAQPVFAPADEPWGQRTSYIKDPDGNLIEISSFNRN